MIRRLSSSLSGRIKLLALCVPLMLLVASCNGGASEGGPSGQQGGGGAPSQDGRSGGPGGPGGGPGGGRPPLPKMAVAVEPAATGSISTYYSATASLDPDKQADILARVNGTVNRLLVEEGDRVTAGQSLLQIEDAEYRHRLTMAEVELERQRLRFERIDKMVESGLVSSEEYDIARTDLEAAAAAAELATLELGYTAVRSPFNGRVVRRHVDPGQTVANGTVLYTLADMTRLLARVHVPAREFRRIRTEQPVQLVVDSTGDKLTGRIDLVSPVVDSASGTIKVTVEITDYPESTRPGDFAEVLIVTDRHDDALLVPRIAVLTEREERVVYVATDDTAERRVVEIGFEDDTRSEIVGGLAAGEAVVIQGQRSLADGQPLTLLDRLDFDSDVDLTPDQDEAEQPPQGKEEGNSGQQGQQRRRSRPGG